MLCEGGVLKWGSNKKHNILNTFWDIQPLHSPERHRSYTLCRSGHTRVLSTYWIFNIITSCNQSPKVIITKWLVTSPSIQVYRVYFD